MANKLARVLVQTSLGSIILQPNQILEADAKVIASLKSNGYVDDDAEAIKYCKSIEADIVKDTSEAAPAAKETTE